MGDRVSQAIIPHYTTIGDMARMAPVNSIDETSWRLHGDRHGLWGMAHPLVAYLQIHPNRSQAAFQQLMAHGKGILVRDGSRVSQYWQGVRQSCVAHLIRTAKGLAERVEADIGRFGGMARCNGGVLWVRSGQQWDSGGHGMRDSTSS